jgi:signal transduction histidine kinase
LAEEQMATLNRIANQTLGFARSVREPQASNLRSVAEAALRIHQRTIEAKKVHLVKDLEDAIGEVNPGEMLQVISNVVDNALDALSMEGTLCLRLRKRRGEIQLLIADNGHGIAKENLPFIFQPFFTTKEGRGTGLGLSLSRNIVDRHCGKICLRSSDRPGRCGTAFRISFPVVAGL